jgi:hypothetical protein
MAPQASLFLRQMDRFAASDWEIVSTGAIGEFGL